MTLPHVRSEAAATPGAPPLPRSLGPDPPKSLAPADAHYGIMVPTSRIRQVQGCGASIGLSVASCEPIRTKNGAQIVIDLWVTFGNVGVSLPARDKAHSRSP
jgi:hypothetical protein